MVPKKQAPSKLFLVNAIFYMIIGVGGTVTTLLGAQHALLVGVSPTPFLIGSGVALTSFFGGVWLLFWFRKRSING